MAREWTGAAPKVTQVVVGEVGASAPGDDYVIPLVDPDRVAETSSFTYIVTAADTTPTLVAAAIALAWNQAPNYLHARVSATNVGPLLYLTSRVSGSPFVLGSVSGTGAWVTALAVSVANSGPNVVGNPYNWDLNADPPTLPTTGDSIVKLPGTPDMLYDLVALTAALGSINLAGNFGRKQDGRLYSLYMNSGSGSGAGTVTINATDTTLQALYQGAASGAVSITGNNTGETWLCGGTGYGAGGISVKDANVKIGGWPGDAATLTASFINNDGGTVTLGHRNSTITITTSIRITNSGVFECWKSLSIATANNRVFNSGIWRQQVGLVYQLDLWAEGDEEGQGIFYANGTGTHAILNLFGTKAQVLREVVDYGTPPIVFTTGTMYAGATVGQVKGGSVTAVVQGHPGVAVGSL